MKVLLRRGFFSLQSNYCFASLCRVNLGFTLTKRTVDLFNRSLPQRKTQFNTTPETEALLLPFTNPNSKKFHPYLSNLNADHLRRDFNHSLAVGISAWRDLQARLFPKRALLSFTIMALALLNVGTANDFQKVTHSQGVVLAGNHLTVAMTANIVAEAVPHFQWPVLGYISTNYSRWHQGIDIPKPKGTPVKPIAAGVVTVVENGRWGYGKSVIVTHPGGYASRYAHLSKIDVKIGDTVSTDTSLGGVGNTGRSTGNHLHIEIYENGHTLNPKNILPAQPSVAAANK